MATDSSNPIDNADEAAEKRWHIVQTVEVEAPAEAVWQLVGGFFTVHTWHPDIDTTEIPTGQTSVHAIRRFLTFPGPPISTTNEELEFIDNAGRHYGYKWHAGQWGEEIKEYHSTIRVVEMVVGQRCMVQWQGWFVYSSDGLSTFYRRGLDALADHF